VAAEACPLMSDVMLDVDAAAAVVCVAVAADDAGKLTSWHGRSNFLLLFLFPVCDRDRRNEDGTAGTT
jgi:hypothetical protein